MTRGKTRFGSRKSPVRHTRRSHYRKGKPVSETQVGNGYSVEFRGKEYKAGKFVPKEDEYFTEKEGLDYSVSLTIPSTQDVDKKVSKKEFDRRIIAVKKKLNSIYGGTTSVKAVGSYTTDKGKLVKEKVYVVTAHADKNSFNNGKKSINSFVNFKKKKWGQEAIGVTLETPSKPSKTLHFV